MIKISELDRKDYIKHKLETDPIWNVRALMLLYNSQTKEEIGKQETTSSNNIGFRQVDAGVLTRFAIKWLKEKKEFQKDDINYNNIFDANCQRVLKKTIPRYWKQVLDNCIIEKLDIEILKREIKLKEELLKN